MLIGLLALSHLLLAPLDTPAGKQQTRMIEASAHNADSGLLEKSEKVDRKQIDIEEGYVYVSHAVSIITANPKDEKEGRWSFEDGVIKGEDGSIKAVWVEVRAGNKGLLDNPVWVRAQLTVIVEERDVGN